MTSMEHKIHQSTIKGRESKDKCPWVLITGITGKQGGGVLEHLYKTGKYNIRGLTRSVTDIKAESLKKKFPNVELVQADLNIRDSLGPLVKGIDFAFLVTDFFDTHDESLEYAAGKNFMDCCKQGGVKHVVFSGLPSATNLSKGFLSSGIKVPHFDGKGNLEEYLRSLQISHTIVEYAFYWENFLSFLKPKKDGNRCWLDLPMGDKQLGGVSVSDGGAVVAKIFESCDSYKGAVISICAECLTGEQFAQIMSKHCGHSIEYRPMSLDDFAKLGTKDASEFCEMFRFFQSYGNKIWTPMPGLQLFDTWCREHSSQLML